MELSGGKNKVKRNQQVVNNGGRASDTQGALVLGATNP